MKKYNRVYLEITNCCNLHCSFCPGTRRIPQFITPELFEKRIRMIAPLAEQIFLHVLGEPLLHPELSTLIDICTRYRIPVNIVSNGTLLTDELESVILRETVRQINFSLQALNECSPSVAESTVQRIIAFCDKSFLNRPDLYINLRTWDYSDHFHNSNTVRCMLSDILHHFNCQTEYNIFSSGRKSKNLKGRIFWNADTLFEWPIMNKTAEIKRENYGFCHGLESQFAVLVGGEVVPCCLDSEANIILGNINTADISQILSSARAEAMLKSFLCGNIIEPLCKNCTYRNRFNKKYAVS